MYIVPDLKIPVTIDELLDRLFISHEDQELANQCEKSLGLIRNRLNPSIMYQWMVFKNIGKNGRGVVSPEGEAGIELNFGDAITHLHHAEKVIISIYTAGSELENQKLEESRKGNFFEAYCLDQIGWIILEKLGEMTAKIAHEKASALGWAPGPFLSPGSVTGWELTDQKKLCSLLPIYKINVRVDNNAVLSPFNTMSGLIGIGSTYEADTLGRTCDVCCKKDSCQMNQTI